MSKYTREHLYHYLRTRIEDAFTCNSTTKGMLEESYGGGFGSKCPLPPWAFEQTPVVKAVNALSVAERTLLHFVVGITLKQEDISALLTKVYYVFYQQYHVYQRLNATSVPKAQSLVEYALINYRLSLCGAPVLAKKEIMKGIKVTDLKTYKRDWAPRLLIMNTVIGTMEREALEKVIKSIDEYKDKKSA